jgi:hypothetical protein
MMLPGSRALAFASRWFDPATVHRTFEPLVADWQREWRDAQGSKRRLVSARQWWGFILACAVSTPLIVTTAAPRDVINNVTARIALFVGIVTTLLMLPPVVSLWLSWTHGASWVHVSLLLFAVPTAMRLAFPFAMAGAVDAIRRSDKPDHVERAAAVKLAAFATILLLIVTGWIVPAANRASRVAMNPPGMSAPLRNMGELTLVELVTDPSRATVFAPDAADASRTISRQRELNSRLAWTALPVVLVWLRWGARNRARRRWFSPMPAVIASLLAMGLVITIAGTRFRINAEWPLWAGCEFWLPTVLFLLWGQLAAIIGRRTAAAA